MWYVMGAIERLNVFLLLAGVGFILLLFSLVFDDILDGLLDGILPEGGWLSLPSIAAAMFAFGATAFILEEQTDIAIGTVVGIAGVLALVCGAAAVYLSKTVMNLTTDATPTSNDVLGTTGRVITPIAAGSTGEILTELAGQMIKITARCTNGTAIALGTNVVVVSMDSPTRVAVQDAKSFWTDAPTEREI